MYLILFAEDYGTKLWPFTSEKLPKSLIPMYSDKNLLEETFGRMPADFMDVNKIFVVVTREGARSILKTKMLDYYHIPRKNLIVIPKDCGDLVSAMFAIKYLEKLVPNIDSTEPVFFSPVDHFFWPPEVFAFHAFNMISHVTTNPSQLMCVSIQPGGPTGQIDFVQVDWDSVQPIGMSQQDDEDEDDPTFVSMKMDVVDFHPRTDVQTSKKYMESNWLWEIQTYIATFDFFKGVSEYIFSQEHPSISQEIDSMFSSSYWYWKQNWNSVKNSERWENIETLSFNKDLLPQLIAEKRVVTTLFSKMVWCVLRDWVAIKQLLYNTGLFTMSPPDGVHQIDAERNLVFKPGEKEITLVGVNDLIVIDSGEKLLIATPEGLYEHF